MKVLKNTVFRPNDMHGSGAFGASRGSRKHIGVDLVAQPGTYVYSPFSGTITKQGYAYVNAHYRYIEITGSEYRCRIFYAKLDDAHRIGKRVDEGQFLGVAQDIAGRYPGITPHVHFELYKTGSNVPLDPTELLKKKTSLT